METNTIYANIFAAMTTKLSTMKSNSLINDYRVDCTIRDWSCDNDETDYSSVEVEVNAFPSTAESVMKMKFDREHPFTVEEYDAFNENLNQIVNGSLDSAKAELEELKKRSDELQKSIQDLSSSAKVKPVDKEYYGF